MYIARLSVDKAMIKLKQAIFPNYGLTEFEGQDIITAFKNSVSIKQNKLYIKNRSGFELTKNIYYYLILRKLSTMIIDSQDFLMTINMSYMTFISSMIDIKEKPPQNFSSLDMDRVNKLLEILP